MVVLLPIGQFTMILWVLVLPSIVEYFSNQLDRIYESIFQPMFKRNELLLSQRLLLLLLQRIIEEKDGKNTVQVQI